MTNEVGEQLVVGAVHNGAFGHVDHEVGTAHAVLLLAGAVRARTRLAVRVVTEREQRRHVAVRAKPDVAATTAVAAVGPASRYVRLAPERHTARAAVAAFHIALRYVDEAGHPDRIRTSPPAAPCSPYDRAMRRSRLAVVAAIVASVALGACSSSHNASPPTTQPPTTTTSPSFGPASAARIDSLTGPPTPPVCNAPTQVELHWSTHGAKTVSLRINGGPVFATYPNGKSDELVPLACTGSAQTYLLTARDANGRATTKSLTVSEHEVSAS